MSQYKIVSVRHGSTVPFRSDYTRLVGQFRQKLKIIQAASSYLKLFRNEINTYPETISPDVGIKLQAFLGLCGIDHSGPMPGMRHYSELKAQALHTISLLISLTYIIRPNSDTTIEMLDKKYDALNHVDTLIKADLTDRSTISRLTEEIWNIDFPTGSIDGQVEALLTKRRELEIKLTHERQIKTSEMMNSLLIGALRGNFGEMLLAINDQSIVLDVAELNSVARQNVSILYQALDAESKKSSVNDQWIAIASNVLGLCVDASVLEYLIPNPPLSSSDCNRVLDRLPEAIRIQLRGILDHIGRMASLTDDETQIRWTGALSRIHEALGSLTQTDLSTVSHDSVLECSEYVRNWRNDIEQSCSVGVDLRSMEFCAGFINRMVVAPAHVNRLEQLQEQHFFQSLVTCKLQQLLTEISIPMPFVSDVHHLNLVMQLVFNGNQASVPRPILDPYVAGLADRIQANSVQIQTRFSNPDWLIDGYIAFCGGNGRSLPTFGELRELLPFLRSDPHRMTPSLQAKINVIESVFKVKSLPELDPLFAEFDLDAIHSDIGGHGVLRMVALSGRHDVFEWLTSKLTTTDRHWEQRDTANLTLIDYAVLGGNTKISQHLWDSGSQSGWLRFIAESAGSTTTPSLMALAGESGNPEMIRYVSRISGETAPRMILACDVGGHTAMMRAAMSGNPLAVDTLLDLCSDLDISHRLVINASNSAGQTPLILSICHAKSKECVAVLLKNGANPNAQIPSSRLTVLQLAMIEGNCEIVKQLLSHSSTVISDDALTTPSTTECMIAIYSTALDSHPDILAKPYGATCIANWLSQANAPTLVHLMADKPPKFVRTVLTAKGLDNHSVAHSLARYDSSALAEIFKGKSERFIARILSESNGFFNVMQLLGDADPSSLKTILGGKSSEFVTHVLSSRNSQGGRMAHSLVKKGTTLAEILEGQQAHTVREILALETNDGFSVAFQLLQHNLPAIQTIFLAIDEPTLYQVFKIADASGKSIAAWLVYFDSDAFLKNIGNKSEWFINSTLCFSDSSGTTVAHHLAQNSPQSFLGLLEKLPTGARQAILDTHDGYGLTVADYMAIKPSASRRA